MLPNQTGRIGPNFAMYGEIIHNKKNLSSFGILNHRFHKVAESLDIDRIFVNFEVNKTLIIYCRYHMEMQLFARPMCNWRLSFE